MLEQNIPVEVDSCDYFAFRQTRSNQIVDFKGSLMGAPFRYENLQTNSLELDTSNPRIRMWIEMYGDSPTAEQIYMALGAGSSDSESSSTTFNSLRESIRTNGGIIHPIIVNRLPAGRLVVIEGNTRVAIFRNFQSDGVVGNWSEIPAMVYDDLAQVGIDSIRLQAHLVGPRDWDAYSKAKYLHHLRDVENMPFNMLVDLCGGKKKEVQNYIAAYADMEKHYRNVISSDSDFDPSRFSAFVELQATGVKQAVLGAQFTLDDFSQWVHERLIDPLHTVRLLRRILPNNAAKEVFLRDGAKEAAKLLDAPPPASAQALDIEDLARALVQKISQLAWKDVERLKSNPSLPLAQALMEVEETVGEMCRHIRDEDA